MLSSIKSIVIVSGILFIVISIDLFIYPLGCDDEVFQDHFTGKSPELKVVGEQYIRETIEARRAFDPSLLPLLSRTFDGVEVSTTGFTSHDRVR
jgi:hypothetical protein